MNNLISEEWLKALNTEFRKNDIQPKKRPWEAIRRLSIDFGVSVGFPSKEAKQIFEWFVTHSKSNAYQMGSLFESVYFFDAQFWLLSVPISCGTIGLNPLDSLEEMPENIKNELMSNEEQENEFVNFWGDCIDYGFGFDDLNSTSGLNEYGMQLFKSGNEELRVASAILNKPRPDSRAILACRLAVEIFFKSYIALKNGLTEKEAKSISHNLKNGFDKFIEVSGFKHWESLREELDIFPEIQERYKPQDIPLKQLWNSFIIAQSLGAVIVREYTDRDILGQKNNSDLKPPNFLINLLEK